MATSPRSTYAWQQAAALCLERHGPVPICWLCGKPIDLTLRWPHPMSKSVDHVIPLHDGGPLLDQDNLRPAHLTHNVSRGNHTRQRSARNPSRTW